MTLQVIGKGAREQAARVSYASENWDRVYACMIKVWSLRYAPECVEKLQRSMQRPLDSTRKPSAAGAPSLGLGAPPANDAAPGT
jgi:hypothetical protein